MKKEDKDKEYKYDEPRDPVPCSYGCGGMMTWCGVCNQWTHTCCVDYGTCMCS